MSVAKYKLIYQIIVTYTSSGYIKIHVYEIQISIILLYIC